MIIRAIISKDVPLLADEIAAVEMRVALQRLQLLLDTVATVVRGIRVRRCESGEGL